jgi:Fn3 associated
MWRSYLLPLLALPLLAVASGCHVLFPIEPQGDDDQGAAPRVFSSPGPAWEVYGGYPKSFAITLAADEPGTTIYYTTDGSVPEEGSPTTRSATTPVPAITISATTMVRYFGVGAGAPSTPVSETFTISSSSPQTNAGYLVTNTTLDGTSPVVIAAPGAMLTARANVQAWVQTGCSACAAQVVYGVDDTDQGCLYDGGPGLYPGVTATGKTFNVRAPTAPGVHEVRIVHIEETSCAAAMATKALQTRPTLARIGVIVVR